MHYFSKSFTTTHIVANIKLPAKIKVHSRNGFFTVKMVMSMSMVKGIPKGGAMMTTNWKDVVKANKMRVNQKYVFWFNQHQDGSMIVCVDSISD